MNSERTGEYLESIFKRQSEKTPVSTSSLAEDLKVSLPAVSDMLKHLKKEGFIDYKPNRGTTLTDTGRQKALQLIRRHRLWERFMTDILDMKWDKVHEEACKLEHIESPELEKGLAKLLGDIETCPHGQPIPDSKGNIKTETILRVANLQPGQNARVIAITNENARLLRDIGKLGLKPGSEVEVVKKNEDKSLELKLNGNQVVLNPLMASAILAKPVEPKTTNVSEEKIPLSNLKSGQFGTINTYLGKRSMLGRFLSLGFTPGSQVKMVKNYKTGPLLVKIHDTSIAIGRGLAEKIIIFPN
jgi:DtxR family transcriptional regulator, Mn-dependent transcriptional regulator